MADVDLERRYRNAIRLLVFLTEDTKEGVERIVDYGGREMDAKGLGSIIDFLNSLDERNAT